MAPRVLIYGINFSPELTGIGKYTGEMVSWLSQHGYDVCVVTAPPYYPAWKVENNYSKFRYYREEIEEFEVWRCPLYVPERPRGVTRVLHLASFALSSFPVVLGQAFRRPSVILVIEPPLFCAPAAWLLAKIAGGKCWLHVQDFEVDAAFELNIIRSQWLRSLVTRVEQRLMRCFDVVSTISLSMKSRLVEKGVSPEKATLFPNWTNSELVKFDPEGRDRFRKELGISRSECLCLYSGNISTKQGLEILVEVAERLPKVRFLICGDGASKQGLQDKVQGAMLQNVEFLSLQPLAQLPSLLSAADIHLVIQRADAADLVLPSKLTNIFAVAGAAIVTAGPETELGRLAAGESPCVYRCDPESPDGLVSAISFLVDHPDQRELLQQAAQNYAEKYIAMDQVLGRFEKHLNGLVKK